MFDQANLHLYDYVAHHAVEKPKNVGMKVKCVCETVPTWHRH